MVAGVAGLGLAEEPAGPLPGLERIATPQIQTDVQQEFTTGLRFIQERKYASAAESFQRVVQLQPMYPEAYANWGIALVQMGKQALALDKQLQAYQQAAEKFSKSAEQNPKEKLTLLLWSETLVLIGDLPLDARIRLGCYQGAVEKCKRAAELAPGEWETYNKWGAILSTKLPDFAVDDKARIQLYREAAQLFATASKNARYSSDLAPLYANWGSALVRAARIATDLQEKTKLLTDAIEKFERAAKTTPNAGPTYSMWGAALIEKGKLSHLRGDFRDGIDKLNTALSLNAKDAQAVYNLAKAYAVQGNNVLAKQWLKKLPEMDSSRQLLQATLQDPDFTGLRDDPEYIDLLNPGGLSRGTGPGPRPSR
jgi:Flp pilus assembly protein TadD